MVQNKQSLREEVWDALEQSGDSLFPGTEGRIPNFKGRTEAAESFRSTSIYKNASTIKINPDSPQKPVRKMALEDGKILFMAVPKLRQRKCFLKLDPEALPAPPEKCATIKGATKYGKPIHPSNMPPIDLIVTGVVATDTEGKRLGKGGGYTDLEFVVLLKFDLIDITIPIISTLHPVQELEQNRIPFQDQDISLSQYFRPDKTVKIESPLPRPDRLLKDKLDREKINSIPVLKDLMEV